MIRAALMLLLVAAPAAAQVNAPQVYGLTEAEKAQVLDAASRRPDADNPALLPALPADRRAHGEVGAMIGSGGARGIYGVVGVPVGENGSATFAFSNTRLPGFYGYGPLGGGYLDRRNIDRQSFGFGFSHPGW